MSPTRNVLFILCDQLNAQCLGHAGHPQVKTPHLDRLAADGVRCTDVVCANPICTPSRVSFLSGQYCHNHGYFGLCGPEPRGLPSFLGHARSHGYRTAAIGKIHCPAGWLEGHCDIFHETTNCSVGGTSAAYTAFLGQRAALEDHGAMPELGPQGTQSMEGRPSPLTFAESQEGWIAAETIRQMHDAQTQQKPFVMHVSFPRPHQCTAPSQEFWDLYEDEPALPPTADMNPVAAGKAPHLIDTAADWQRKPWPILEPRTHHAARSRKMRGYLAAVSQVDAAVGLLLDHLRETGLDENTLVIFSADHGEYVTGWGLMEKAPGICADAVTRIPLLMRGPGLPRGSEVTAQLHAVDIAPTICNALELPPLRTANGQDLGPLLRRESGAASAHTITVTEFAWSKAVRKGKWRMVWYPPQLFAAQHPVGFGELYDLESDPWETKNRWHDPACTEMVRELERDLLTWLVTTTRPVTSLGASTHDDLGPDAVPTWHGRVQADGKIPGDRLNIIGARNYL